ncbi:MAG TPA: patatin-like phospholipase family protein, partial [Nitrososphaera sp.]|nr:patatin-like phospholipase family protein [Nitrososphaera sp.]
MRELKKKHSQEPESETVLAMQAGGSLGAYECGVFRGLTKRGIKFDIVAGTSIGAVNAGIVAGSKSSHPEKDLENFWLDVAETVTPSTTSDYIRAVMASSYSALYGNPKMFSPIWFKKQNWGYGYYFDYFRLYNMPYLYDMTLLKDTLYKYIDFKSLNMQNTPRLIVACTDVQKSKYVVFDSHNSSIDATHLVACASYPFYGIGWTEIGGKYLWDGTLLGNTPLVNVIDSSSKRDKNVYIVNVFPHEQEKLPDNLMDVWHRARDIVFT